MPIGLVIDMQGMTREIYDALDKAIGFPSEVPDGLISHIAGPTEGGFRVVDVWESVEDYDRFVESKLGPAMGEIEGAEALAPPSVQEFEIHNRFSR